MRFPLYTTVLTFYILEDRLDNYESYLNHSFVVVALFERFFSCDPWRQKGRHLVTNAKEVFPFGTAFGFLSVWNTMSHSIVSE